MKKIYYSLIFALFSSFILGCEKEGGAEILSTDEASLANVFDTKSVETSEVRWIEKPLVLVDNVEHKIRPFNKACLSDLWDDDFACEEAGEALNDWFDIPSCDHRDMYTSQYNTSNWGYVFSTQQIIYTIDANGDIDMNGTVRSDINLHLSMLSFQTLLTWNTYPYRIYGSIDESDWLSNCQENSPGVYTIDIDYTIMISIP